MSFFINSFVERYPFKPYGYLKILKNPLEKKERNRYNVFKKGTEKKGKKETKSVYGLRTNRKGEVF